MAESYDRTNTFHSFSGVDIHAVFGNVEFGEIQMVSYKADREKAPVYVMGSSDPRTIARGKRLITGAVVFVVFEVDSLIQAMTNSTENPYLSVQETANYNTDGSLKAPPGGSKTYINPAVQGTNTFNAEVDITKLNVQAAARMADQLLPFDITLVGANEYGKTTTMKIHQVELMSEAGGISIDDLVIEKQISFIARNISNWTSGRAASGAAESTAQHAGAPVGASAVAGTPT